MSKPFTYCITHKTSNKRYYGCRYAKGCNPKDLGSTYFTSSKHVSQLIKKEGLENFLFEVRKIFTSAEKCRSWEHRVLIKLNAAKSNMWYNKHNGGQTFFCAGHTEATRKKMSDTHIKNGTHKGIPKPDHVGKAVSEANRKRIISDETRTKKSIASSGSNNPNYGKLGANSPNYGKKRSQEQKDNIASSEYLKSKRTSVIIEGTYYTSVLAAARALNRSTRYIRSHDQINPRAYYIP